MVRGRNETTFPLVRSASLLLLLALTACSDRGAKDEARATDVRAGEGGAAGTSGASSGAGGGAAGEPAGGAGTAGGGGSPTISREEAKVLCANAVIGAPCPRLIQKQSASYLVACDLDAADDASCRAGLSCETGVWAPRERQPGQCLDHPACATAPHWGYCRNEAGTLCFLPDTGPLRCLPEEIGFPGYPLWLPLLGTPCEEHGRQVLDCGLGAGGRECVDGVWWIFAHTCK